jgi:hypothetical protein
VDSENSEEVNYVIRMQRRNRGYAGMYGTKGVEEEERKAKKKKERQKCGAWRKREEQSR